MAISLNGLAVFAFLVTLAVFETWDLFELPRSVLPELDKEEQLLPRNRQRRNALLTQLEYKVEVELNGIDVATVNYLRSLLDSNSFFALGPTVNVTSIDITTVCYPNARGFQCRCEDQYVWSSTACATYGACDDITNDTCSCINSIPSNGRYCQPQTETSVVYEYQVFIEVNTTDADELRSDLRNVIYPLQVSRQTNIWGINVTTVCSQHGVGYQCRCEDSYLWPCDTCFVYGKCGGDTNSTCSCIQSIHPDEQYYPTCPATVEYLVSLELTVPDVGFIHPLRSILSNISYPVSIKHMQISDVNISTVCSVSSGGYQCRCEDQYRWSCDQCVMYGSCDIITSETCGCINAIPPDGQYCQPVDQYNFTSCPVTTTPSPTTLPVVYEYIITVELNTTDVTVIDRLRNISYPVSINNNVQVSGMNISTVCSVSSGGYQCRCEDQYRWSCDQCVMYGSCDIITSDTCGCINAVPPDGQYCQPLTDALICPSTTPPVVTTTPVAPTPNTTTALPPTTSAVTVTEATSQNATAYTTSPAMPSANTKDTATTYALTTTTTVTTTRTTTTIITTTPTMVNTTTASPASTATTTGAPTPAAAFQMEMSMRLNKDYDSELSNPSSSVYENLKSQIDSVLHEQYKGIPGYIRGFVTGFSEGSIITQFVVQSTQVVFENILEENKKLPVAMSSIAPVNGTVSAFFESSTSISLPELTYTGATLSMKCGPPKDFNVEQKFSSRWTFKGREIKDGGRFKITNSISQSVLEVNNVIPADSGPYGCTLNKGNIEVQQKGYLTGSHIQQAPVVRLQSELNVKCVVGLIQPLTCCVQRPYNINWFQGDQLSSVPVNDEDDNCINHDYKLENCIGSQEDRVTFTCRVENPSSYEMTSTMRIFKDNFKCNDAQYGTGRVGDISVIECDEGQEGNKMAECQETGEWRLERDTCIITEIKQLLIESQDLVDEEVPDFVGNLSRVVQRERSDVSNSIASISAIIDMLTTVANVSDVVDETIMQNVLETVDVIISEETKESWVILNANETRNASSALLGSLETLSNDLVGEFAIRTPRILLNRTKFDNSFVADLNSSIVINITDTSISNVFITTILLSTLNVVMPTRNSTFDISLYNTTSNETASDDVINAAVLLVKINTTVQDVLLSFNKLNSSLAMNPQCVFWNFTLLDNLGAWDDEGCVFVSDINDTVTCSCNHLTSFSILMATGIPPSLREALDIITYVGVGISMASLVICLIIEGYIWKPITRNSTAFMRHVSVVNTALSLLIADICFIVGASIANNPLENPGEDYELPLGPCSTATFFMHFFYLALFFWMLVSGLLLFYRTVMVFSYMSKSTMLAIGFCLGYGCPLIIAVVTVATTAPGNGYIRKSEACWLNWDETKALLAMVIPALTIVAINFLIVLVVVFKMLRRGVGDAAQTDEKHTLVVITRCLVILTPLFGLTWSLGVGTMVSSTNKGLHIAFAFFNSLQGFFILLFGVLLDSKTRSLLAKRFPLTSTGSSTKTAGAGISSLSGNNLIGRLLGRRNVYHVSQAANSNSVGATESFINL